VPSKCIVKKIAGIVVEKERAEEGLDEGLLFHYRYSFELVLLSTSTCSLCINFKVEKGSQNETE
jgi:hypothetical protein